MAVWEPTLGSSPNFWQCWQDHSPGETTPKMSIALFGSFAAGRFLQARPRTLRTFEPPLAVLLVAVVHSLALSWDWRIFTGGQASFCGFLRWRSSTVNAASLPIVIVVCGCGCGWDCGCGWNRRAQMVCLMVWNETESRESILEVAILALYIEEESSLAVDNKSVVTIVCY